VRIAQEYGAPPAGSAFHARAEATSGKIFFQHDVNFHLQTLFPQKNYFALSISLLISKAITVAFDKLQPRIFACGTCFALAFATLAMFFGFRAASRLHPGIRSLAFTILFLPGTVVFSERCM
jgi:hypothetical protein